MGKVTLKQISERTGYSQATVSNVLNRKKEVNAETAKRILLVADQLGYAASKKMEKIILVMYRKSGQILMETPLILSVIDGVEKEGQKHRIETIIYNINARDYDYMSQMASLLNEKRCGIILLATELDEADVKVFQKLTVPFVIVDAWFKEENYTTVLMDNRSSFERAVAYLAEKGHRNIGYIGNRISIRNFEERERGYRDAMNDLGLAVEEKYCVSLAPTLSGAQETMKEYLQQKPELPTAYVAVNDIIALGAIKALKDAGYHVPNDVSVIGFDNMPFGNISSPALTTFNVHKEEIGQAAAQLLLRQSEGIRTPLKIEVLTELIERDSVKDIRN